MTDCFSDESELLIEGVQLSFSAELKPLANNSNWFLFQFVFQTGDDLVQDVFVFFCEFLFPFILLNVHLKPQARCDYSSIVLKLIL